MLIDVSRERPISFNAAAKFLPEGTRPHLSTWWRWWRFGLRGIRLETVVIGGRRYTTAAAVQRFAAALTRASVGAADAPQSERTTDTETEQGLDAAGIG